MNTVDFVPPGLPAPPVPSPAGADSLPEVVGQWQPLFKLPAVGIHTHLLPNGNVLFWGRRPSPDDTLDVQRCAVFVWNRTDPSRADFFETPQPIKRDESPVNLFCSGHTFLEDGRLLVVGGHIVDSVGQNQSCLYDWKTNSWTASGQMTTHGRWYPTVLALADGKALVASGSYDETGTGSKIENNSTPEVWNDGRWKELRYAVFVDTLDQRGVDTDPDNIISLYPRLHITPQAEVFMSGTLARSFFLNPAGNGKWTPMAGDLGGRINKQRDYAPAIEYAPGKIIYIGGGHNDRVNFLPTNATEIIDLTVAPLLWKSSAPMAFPRRQHNAALLPDGTVLVTGGTRGGGPPGQQGFNDLTPGMPVHEAELWGPVTDTWTALAAEDIDRCYHGTLLLLPDATLLSAGGGEYKPSGNMENAPKDSHWDAQIFKPPYLFKGARPVILTAPATVTAGTAFSIDCAVEAGEEIAKVSLIRHGSVTHSMNQSQGICFPEFKPNGAGKLLVTVPAFTETTRTCAPGPYMLFVLSARGVPSVAALVTLGHPETVAQEDALPQSVSSAGPAMAARVAVGHEEANALAIRKAREAGQTRVTVGVTPTCPYGISACWGGAVEGLRNLEGVVLVERTAQKQDSLAYVFLANGGLPLLDRWPEQFRERVNGSYGLRGVEVTLDGTLQTVNGILTLAGDGVRPAVALAPLLVEDKVQWDIHTGKPRPVDSQEAQAFPAVARLGGAAEEVGVRVTGPLRQNGTNYTLEVRVLEHVD